MLRAGAYGGFLVSLASIGRRIVLPIPSTARRKLTTPSKGNGGPTIADGFRLFRPSFLMRGSCRSALAHKTHRRKGLRLRPTSTAAIKFSPTPSRKNGTTKKRAPSPSSRRRRKQRRAKRIASVLPPCTSAPRSYGIGISISSVRFTPRPRRHSPAWLPACAFSPAFRWRVAFPMMISWCPSPTTPSG
jgi:hypothetical protein